MKNTECTTEHCSNKGVYALFEYFANGTKIWRTDLCEKCEKAIAKRNAELRAKFPIGRFVEK